MKTLLMTLTAAATLFLTSCDEKTPAPKAAVKVEVPADAISTEAACGRCIFKVEGAKGCPTYVKIDGKALPFTGLKVNAHKLGLCKAGHPAKVAGAVKDGQFVATHFSLDTKAPAVDSHEGHMHEGDAHEGHTH